MATNKIDRIEKEMQKTREKITEYQNKLKGLEAQRTEAENLQIISLVRSMRVSPEELTAMLGGNAVSGLAPEYTAHKPTHNTEQEENEDEE